MAARIEEFEIDVSMFDMSREFPPEPTAQGYAMTRVVQRPMPEPLPRERAPRGSYQSIRARTVREDVGLDTAFAPTTTRPSNARGPSPR